MFLIFYEFSDLSPVFNNFWDTSPFFEHEFLGQFSDVFRQQKFENLQAAQEVFEEMATATRRSAAFVGRQCVSQGRSQQANFSGENHDKP